MDGRAISHPWQEIRRMQREVERLFSDLAPAGRWPLTGEYPPINLTRTDTGLVIDALCPGADPQSLEVTVVGEAISIRCERKPEPDVQPDRYHRRERPLGAFTRTISVGERFDPDRTRASYRDGILEVQLERSMQAEPRKIPVQSGS